MRSVVGIRLRGASDVSLDGDGSLTLTQLSLFAKPPAHSTPHHLPIRRVSFVTRCRRRLRTIV